MTTPVRRRRSRLLVPTVILFLLGYCYLTSFRMPLRVSLDQLSSSTPPTAGSNGLVPLEAHIISKCPDTRDALRKLILPAMQVIHEKVDFKLTYIGTPTGDDGVECMHGPSECMGNIIELCARELYPDPKINLGFIMCLTKDYKNIPERTLVEDCALEHAIDIRELNECATRDTGAHGMDMLRKSVRRSAEVSITSLFYIYIHSSIMYFIF
ncbi:hypothetical protein K4F52_003489 [Lecanicillium sp. MT-2017a]|nr:hypothetical protein K4F52_003489 [Lecanicillium sp. MT-2017a]